VIPAGFHLKHMQLRKLSLTALLLSAVVATATTVIPMSVDKMTRLSTVVVEARSIDAHSAWNAEHTVIYTYTRFSVSRVLKGAAPATITVKQMGGHADGYTQRVSGVRHWSSGEEAVLFLHPSVANDGTLVVTGLMQGNFYVQHLPTGEVVVGNGVPHVSSFDTVNHSTSTYHGTHMTLRKLESNVQQAVTR